MKNLSLLLCSLLLNGVFGDTEVKVSVKEGDSVTIKINPEDINRATELVWWFNDRIIAEIDFEVKDTPSVYPDGRFRDRLNLERQTGSLTITNIRYQHSGEYKLEIRSIIGIMNKTFRVSVIEDVENLNQFEGRSVTLKTGLNELQTDQEILWKFNDESPILAKIDRETNETSIPGNADERFRDRLKLNDTTGDLIITHSKTSDSGDYKMEIRDSTEAIQKIFRVIVRKIFVPEEFLLVIEGRSVTLKTGLNELQTDQELLWKFNDESPILAKINRETNETSIPGNADERFRDRLKLNDTTGDLIITHSKIAVAGEYKMEIRDNTETRHMRFRVEVREIDLPEEFLMVMEGGSVTLETGLNELQTDQELLWKFNNESKILAKINRETNETSIPGNADERFRDRLKLNDKTGDLTITHSKTSDSGDYKMEIRDNTETIHKIFRVIVRNSVKTKENESTTVVKTLLIKAEDEV